MTSFPTHQDNFPSWWRAHGPQLVADYTSQRTSYIRALSPAFAVKMPGVEVAEILYQRLGAGTFMAALQPNYRVPSPLQGQENGDWIRRSKTVGINVRTIGNFFNVVKYALTLPAHVDTIHLLPIWEAGVVASLYGMASWQLNPEFFSHELLIQYPHLNTVEAQLQVVMNLLHALGKKVGMDVIPHTDRYSEMVLAQPSFFEWLQRQDLTITNHRAQLHEEVEAAIADWLRLAGAAIPEMPLAAVDLKPSRFFYHLSEEQRLLCLFGQAADVDTRRERRIRLLDHLYRQGFEPVPATMAPPYRGLEVDTNSAALTVDRAGRQWRDYRISAPTEMSRIFGPLTRYKLYERLEDNAHWAIDFSRPRYAVWEYVAKQYAQVQQRYGFDFMRGDMSHVQMRPEGTPLQPDVYYDLLAYVKQHIQAKVPYFAYFAESFLTRPDYMAYGDELDHLEASQAETSLGNLQSMVPGEADFLAHFRRYLDIAETRKVTPTFTIITGDKDDPRFDGFYRHGNLARMFTGLFLPKLPVYYALGFEQRDEHPYPFPNENYTKLYVFQVKEGEKATHGLYRWGNNLPLFFSLDRLHAFAEALLPQLDHSSLLWPLPPDPTAATAHLAWQQEKQDSQWLFVVNFGEKTLKNCKIPLLGQAKMASACLLVFSTHRSKAQRKISLLKQQLILAELENGEGLVISLV